MMEKNRVSLTRDIVATIADADIALLEPCLCALAEDKVCSARDEAVTVVLLAVVRQQRVLEPV